MSRLSIAISLMLLTGCAKPAASGGFNGVQPGLRQPGVA